MLEAGEDPLYVARRLVRFASEDVGNADPAALRLTLDAKDAYHFLGTPEGELALAQATCYLALAPKSNAVYAAWNAVRRGGEAAVLALGGQQRAEDHDIADQPDQRDRDAGDFRVAPTARSRSRRPCRRAG